MSNQTDQKGSTAPTPGNPPKSTDRSNARKWATATEIPAPAALDVRPVEPKDRYETIMGAYDALSPGSSFELTLDHDPTCMYYALKATRERGSFGFDSMENGPDVWRVRVEKKETGAGRGPEAA
jgi:uncharacterized protein (DUF2249 family)